MKYIAFLSGPISEISYDNATGWRERFKSMLPDEIQGISPLRGKDYLENETSIADSYEDSPLSCSRGIMTRDFNDTKRCDVLVVNLLGTKRVSIGTVMELAWAYAFRIPIVLMMEKSGNLHDHAMIREAVGFRVETLEEAVKIVKLILLEKYCDRTTKTKTYRIF